MDEKSSIYPFDDDGSPKLGSVQEELMPRSPISQAGPTSTSNNETAYPSMSLLFSPAEDGSLAGRLQQTEPMLSSSSAGQLAAQSRTSRLNPLLVDSSSSSSSSLEPTAAISYSLSSGDLAGIIIAASVVVLAFVAIVVWLHYRRRRIKTASLSADSNGGPAGHSHATLRPVASLPAQVPTISMEMSAKSNGSLKQTNGYLGPMMDGEGGLADEEIGSYTEYGSVMDSFPPSPALSFRSAFDGFPGNGSFSRSRSGTGTSFGTVASFSSHRSALSTTASFHTCVEEEFP